MKVINDSNMDDVQVGDIFITIAVCNSRGDIIEEFDSMKEARAYVKDNDLKNVEYWYLAAETIDEDCNLNPACWGITRAEAIAKLKRALR